VGGGLGDPCAICHELIEGLKEEDSGKFVRVRADTPAAVYLIENNEAKEVSVKENTFDSKKTYSAYHRDCIDTWIKTQQPPTDPLTRAPITEESYGPYAYPYMHPLRDTDKTIVSNNGTALMDSIINGVLGEIYTVAKESAEYDTKNPGGKTITRIYMRVGCELVFGNIFKDMDEYAVNWANHLTLPWEKINTTLEGKDIGINVTQDASKYVALVLEYFTKEILVSSEMENHVIESRHIRDALTLSRYGNIA
jgi:hypothetical protein